MLEIIKIFETDSAQNLSGFGLISNKKSMNIEKDDYRCQKKLYKSMSKYAFKKESFSWYISSYQYLQNTVWL